MVLQPSLAAIPYPSPDQTMRPAETGELAEASAPNWN